VTKLPAPSFVAGHSLGEYTALVAAGALSFEDAVRLARERGRLMQEAGLREPGGMVAILGMDGITLAEICRQTGTVMANINSPGQIVISGRKENLQMTIELAQAKGALRCLPLQVSGAFHSPLMQPAIVGLTDAINKTQFKNPSVPLIANTTATPVTSADAIKNELLDQLCNCVQWQNSIEYMVSQGVNNFIEIGPGKVLTGLIKRINRAANIINIGDVPSIQKLAGG